MAPPDTATNGRCWVFGRLQIYKLAYAFTHELRVRSCHQMQAEFFESFPKASRAYMIFSIYMSDFKDFQIFLYK